MRRSTTFVAEAEPVAALGTLRVAELYLVTACGEGQGAALAEFERSFVPALRSALSRMRLPPSTVDETLQVMRDELFVPRGGAEPKILGYGGRGHLGGWLRAAAHPQPGRHQLDGRARERLVGHAGARRVLKAERATNPREGSPAPCLDDDALLARGKAREATAAYLEAKRVADTWIVRKRLGRA